MAEEKGLLKFEEGTVLDLFTKEGEIDTIIKFVDDEMSKLLKDVDPTTKKGRDTIRTVVARGVHSRTYGVAKANGLTKAWKAQTKLVNSVRDKFELESKENEAKHRKPLSDFENAEKERISEHEGCLERIGTLTDDIEPYTADEIMKRLDMAKTMGVAREWQEFKDQYEELKASVVLSLTASYDARKKYEDDQAELEQHRIEKAERAKEDEAERLRKEGAEKERLAAVAEKEKTDNVFRFHQFLFSI